MICDECRAEFLTENEFINHLSYCHLLRNNQHMNSRINEIFSMVQTINRRININDSFRQLLPTLILSEMNVVEQPSELIDWEYTLNNGIALWENKGKIKLQESDMKNIYNLEQNSLKTARYWKKRVWFYNFLRKKFI